MAIVLDSDSEATTNVSPLSFSHTAAAGATIVVISVGVRSSDVGTISVTYGGASCTQINVQAYTVAVGNVIGAGLFYLLNPTAGSNTVSVTYTGTGPRIAANASSWFGVDAGNPIFDKAKDSGGTNTPTVDCPSEPGSSVVVDACATFRSDASQTLTVDASQTELANQTIGVAGAGVKQGTSYEGATATTTTMSWTIGSAATNAWALCTVAIREDSSRLLAQLGVGL